MRSSRSCTEVGGRCNDFSHPVRSRARRLRDKFQNDDNNHNAADDFNAARAAVLSVDPAGPDHVVAEHHPIAGASCVRSANFQLHSARSQRVERLPAHRLESHQ